jgi:aarF domain-containing kinase
VGVFGACALQIDLRVEANNLQRFIHNFRDMRDITFPSPVRPLVHPEVLVETFEPGVSILQLLDDLPEDQHVHVHTDATSLSSAPRAPVHHPYTAPHPQTHTHEGLMRQEIARLGCATLLRMVVRDNFIHADLHPGAFAGAPHTGVRVRVRVYVLQIADSSRRGVFRLRISGRC